MDRIFNNNDFEFRFLPCLSFFFFLLFLAMETCCLKLLRSKGEGGRGGSLASRVISTHYRGFAN
jgi:hypothetical protein